LLFLSPYKILDTPIKTNVSRYFAIKVYDRARRNEKRSAGPKGEGEGGGEKRPVQRPGHAAPLGVHNPRTMGAGARNNAVYKRRHNAGISETTNGLTADYRQMRGLGALRRRPSRFSPPGQPPEAESTWISDCSLARK